MFDIKSIDKYDVLKVLIPFSDMSRTDLNLIVIFDAIMKEQSITAAAEQLAMTQPSVSNALSRMRHQWRDPLFVKDGRGVKPTPYAEQLWQQINNPIAEIQQAMAPVEFVPQQARRQFRIALTDGMSGILWLPLRQYIEQHAPGIDIYAVPYKADGEELLLTANVDLVMDYYPGRNKQIHSELVFDNHFACIMRPDHELASQNLTLNRFIQQDHLLVSLSGDPLGMMDSLLAKQNKQRRIAMTVNSFSGALEILRESNLIAVMPYSIACKSIERGELIAKALPLPMAPAPISIAWHTRHQRDPGLAWLRDVLRELLSNLDKGYQQELERL